MHEQVRGVLGCSLDVYRRDPSRRNGVELERVAMPVIHRQATRVVQRHYFTQLDPGNDVADLASYGFEGMCHAARRYVFECGICGAVFLRRSRYEAHMREHHRRRGPPAVTLEMFALQSSRRRMLRDARQLITPWDPVDPVDLESGVMCDEDFEDRLHLAMIVRERARKLSDELIAEVVRVLDRPRVNTSVKRELRRELQECFADLKESHDHAPRATRSKLGTDKAVDDSAVCTGDLFFGPFGSHP